MIIRSLSLLFVFASFFSPGTEAQEWPRFRGADGTGLGTGESIPVSFDRSDYDWQVDLPGPGTPPRFSGETSIGSLPTAWDQSLLPTILTDCSFAC